VPNNAADRPSMRIAMLKIHPIGVRVVSKCSTSGFLKTLNA